MTVWVYVNTSKQVGDKDHIKVFANVDAAEKWFDENDPEGVASVSRAASPASRTSQTACLFKTIIRSQETKCFQQEVAFKCRHPLN